MHWPGSQRPGETSADPDATTSLEPPETPAPLFAVRAFKHALFGTPQTTQAKPRRHSTNEQSRPRPIDTRVSRPALGHTRSSSDAQGLSKDGRSSEQDPPSSPTKGILMTPGTAAARRKTVSFGEDVADNENKKPSKTGLPDDFPGKFPSPWVQSTSKDLALRSDLGDDAKASGRSRSKVAEALEQARDESVKRKSRSSRPAKARDDTDLTLDMAEPRSDSGRYWKNEYDIYRENTTKEVRKLLMKQRAAKNFAREKDMQCTELIEQLRHERRKVERLEQKTAELTAQLMQYQQQRSIQSAPPKVVVEDGPMHRTEVATQGSELRTAGVTSEYLPRRDGGEEIPIRSASARPHDIDQPRTAAGRSTIDLLQTHHSDYARQSVVSLVRPRPRPRSTQPVVQSAIWAPPPSNMSIMRADYASKPSRSVTSGTNATPLQSLNVNTLPEDQRALAISMGLKPPTSRISPPRQDSALPSPELQASSMQYIQRKAVSGVPEQANERARPEGVLLRNPLDQEGEVAGQSSSSQTHTAAATGSLSRDGAMPLGSRPPISVRSDENLRPSTAWTSMNTALPPSSKRVIGKDGQEVDADRLAAAKARLLARGRNVS